MANDMIRMSGMNSGLDTESIINALTANSKLKITKQNRQLLKYQATQTAYREIITKMKDLQSKYFDVLKGASNLKGTSMWSRYTTGVSVNGEEKKIAGFSATTSINSTSGTYNITVNKTATQSTLSGSSLSDGAKLDLSSLENGKTYGISVTVGSETKNITFTAGASAEDTLNNVNDVLADAYGESNASNAGDTRGIVYVDNAGKFIARNGKGVTISGTGEMKNSSSLDLSALLSGNNSVTIQSGDSTYNVSFQTLANDYFNPEVDENGNPQPLSEDKQALYDQIKDDFVESKKYDAYNAWKDITTDEDKEALKRAAFADASEEQRAKYLDKYLTKEYNKYALDQKENVKSFEDWKAENFVDNDESNALYQGFKDYYYDHDITPTPEKAAERDEKLAQYIDTKYEAYKDSLGEGETALGKDEWTGNVKSGAAGYEDLTAGYNAIADKYNKYTGFELDYDAWGAASYNEFTAYKDNINTVTEESLQASGEINNQAIINHYNKTSLQNSIGSLETADGTEFDVEITGSQAVVTAKDKEGNAVDFSITAGRDSKNDLGIDKATSSVSQISNSTKLSDIGLETNDNGKYTFTINGKDFAFDKDTTVKEMMRSVNSSDAGVKMSYSSLDNAFTLKASDYGVSGKIDITDGSEGLLSAIGLTSGTNFTQGTNLEVEINGKILESGGNSLEVDGTTFAFTGVEQGTSFDVEIKKDYSSIINTIKGFVEEYNKLIEDVYKALDQKPDKDYYFLADADKEDLDLSEKQEEKWEEKAKLGLLYHDTTISSVMTSLRTSLMGSVEAADGKFIGLAQIGMKTSTDYSEHGKIILDEEALTSAVEQYGDDIMKLFSDSENGIMVKFNDAIEGAIGITGNKGTLVNKAGLSTGTSATDNFISNQMKRIKSKISSLEMRYEKQQDRLWKKYSSMEKMLSTINSQSASMASYFGGFGA